MNQGKVDVLLGLQWGDEGKGKVVDVLTPQYDVVARFQGGPNAGHTLEVCLALHSLRNLPGWKGKHYRQRRGAGSRPLHGGGNGTGSQWS